MGDFIRDAEQLLRAGSIWSWVFALVLAIAFTFLVKTVLHKVVDRVKILADRTAMRWHDYIVGCLTHTRTWSIFIWISYTLVTAMSESAAWLKFAHFVMVAVTVAQVAVWGFCALRIWRDNYLQPKIAEDVSVASAIGLLYAAVQFLFLSALVLMGLSNLGVDIAALIAGLGVGGIAIALAAQNILGDLLASLSIVLDKPFVVGDFIEVGPDSGTVENVGIKTTRLRSVTGEELVFSNKDLLASRIRNFKRTWQRRVLHKFRVAYATPVEKIAAIPEWVKSFVEKDPRLKYERCHLSAFGTTSYDFELVFWIAAPDYNAHLDLQEALLVEIIDKFRKESVVLA